MQSKTLLSSYRSWLYQSLIIYSEHLKNILAFHSYVDEHDH